MEAVELAALFVEAAETKKKLTEIEAQITAAVMEAQETQKIAGVTATFYKPGFGTPNYEAVAKANMPDGYDPTPFTTVRTSVKWKSICDDIGIGVKDIAPGAPKPARVAIKY